MTLSLLKRGRTGGRFRARHSSKSILASSLFFGIGSFGFVSKRESLYGSSRFAPQFFNILVSKKAIFQFFGHVEFQVFNGDDGKAGTILARLLGSCDSGLAGSSGFRARAATRCTALCGFLFHEPCVLT